VSERERERNIERQRDREMISSRHLHERLLGIQKGVEPVL